MENRELNNNDSSSSLIDLENMPLPEADLEEAAAQEGENMIEETSSSHPLDEEMPQTTTETVTDPSKIREVVNTDLEDSSHSSSLTSISSLSYTSQLTSEQLGPADQALQKLKLDSARGISPTTDSNTTIDSLPEDQRDPTSRPKLEQSSTDRIASASGKQGKAMTKFARVSSPTTDSSETTDSLPEDQKLHTKRIKTEDSPTDRFLFDSGNTTAGKQDEVVTSQTAAKPQDEDTGEWTHIDESYAKSSSSKDCTSEGGTSDHQKMGETASRRKRTYLKSFSYSSTGESTSRGTVDDRKIKIGRRRSSTLETIDTHRDTSEWAHVDESFAKGLSSTKDSDFEKHRKMKKAATRKRTYLKPFPSSSAGESSSRETVEERNIKIARRSSASETIRITPRGAHKRTLSAPDSSKSGAMKSAKQVKRQATDEDEEDSNSDSSGSEQSKK